MITLFWIAKFYIIYFKIYLAEIHLLGYKYSKKIFFHCFAMLCIILAIYIFQPRLPTFTILQRLVIAMPMFLLFIELQGKNRIVSLLMVMFGITVYELLVSIFSYGIFDFKIDRQLESYSGSIFLNSIGYSGIIVIMIVKKMFRRYESEWVQKVEHSSLWMVVIVFVAILFYGTPVLVLGVNDRTHKVVILHFMSCTIVTVMILATVHRLYKVNEKRNYFETTARMSEIMMEHQEEYYRFMYERDIEIKKFRHDLNSHLGVLSYLNQLKDYESLGSYIDDIKQEIANIQIVHETGNDIVNMVLSETVGQKLQHDIKFTWYGILPEKLGISQMKICIIFSNILNNALEATASDTVNHDKWIKIKVWNEEKNLMISAENSVEQKVQIKDNQLVTTKKDVKSHGFGSKNVEKIVREEEGKIQYKSKENSFEVRIELPNVIE